MFGEHLVNLIGDTVVIQPLPLELAEYLVHSTLLNEIRT